MTEQVVNAGTSATTKDRHPKYWAHAIGMALLATQNKIVLWGDGDASNAMWFGSMLACLGVGAIAAGIRHAIKKPSSASTGRHFLMVAWVMCVLGVAQSYL